MARAIESTRRDSGNRRVQEIVARFKTTWSLADPWIESIDIAAFLPPLDDPIRLQVLYELVAVDLDIRYQRQQSIGLEIYLAKFPELGTAATVAPELIHEEFAARQRHNQSPSVDEYLQRFPDRFAEFKKCIEEDATATIGMEKSKPLLPVPPPSVISTMEGNVEQFLKQKGYQLFEKLGAGGSGEVRRAEAPGGVEVAVKIIRRSSSEHIMADREQEALELIKRLRHPFLLQTQAYWSLTEYLVIVMELADGTLTKAKDLPRTELLNIFHEAAEAIDFLHDKNIQHRDIKPSNILVLKGHAKVADFGLARLQTSNNQATQAGAGTHAYMAPELLKGNVSKHSDLFSLALSYGELRRGEKVYPDRGANIAAFMYDRLQGTPNLSGLEEGEQRVLRKALNLDPEKRYPTCVAFVAALQEARQLPPARPSVRWPYQAAVAVTLVLALLLLIPSVRNFVFPPKPPEVVWLPNDCVMADDATIQTVGGKRYFNRIVKIKNGQSVPFRLIPRENKGDPPTFYLMENKVSNDLFRTAVNDPEFRRLLDGFRKDYPWTVQEQWEKGGVANRNAMMNPDGRLPVMRVTVTEAYCFAQWLGGNLPRSDEWDKASGRLNGFKAPFRNPDAPVLEGEIAVGREREGPMPVGTAKRDISPFGCFDMAGNGREWTSTIVPSGPPVGVAKPNKVLLVALRGLAYDDTIQLPVEAENFDGSQQYDKPHYSIGFRIALEADP